MSSTELREHEDWLDRQAELLDEAIEELASTAKPKELDLELITKAIVKARLNITRALANNDRKLIATL